RDARDIDTLAKLPIILTTQGGDYTNEIYPELRAAGWEGLWIDAASALRMDDESIIVLDSVNRDQIDAGLKNGVYQYVGGYCSVSLMTLGLGGLLRNGMVE